jgi:TRAP-type C4-dicarboxylate transport system permease small subunit
MEKNTVSAIYDIVKKANSICASVSGLVLLFITFSIFVDVFFRYVLNRPSRWVTEVSGYLLLYLIFLATSYTLEKGVHIRVTFISDLFKFKMKRFLELVGSLFAVIFCFVLLWQTSLLTWEAYRDDWIAPTMLSVRYYYIYVVMAFGSFLLFLTTLFKTIMTFVETEPQVSEDE